LLPARARPDTTS